MSKDISDIIENIQSAKETARTFRESWRNREEEFMFFGQKDVIHDGDMKNETYCETNFAPPYLYPTEALFLRTWRFYSLPEDLTVESKGCKVKRKTFVEEGIKELDMNETHSQHVYFHPTDTGYIIVKSGGEEAKVSWEKREGGSFILSDFTGRKLEVYPSYVKEVRTFQEEDHYYSHRESCYQAIDNMKASSEED